MSDNEISRRGLGGPTLMLSGCTQATGSMSLAFPERRFPDPRFLRQRVQYDGGESPGTIVVDIADRFLYAVPRGRLGYALRRCRGRGGSHVHRQGDRRRKTHWPSWMPTASLTSRKPHLSEYAGGVPTGGADGSRLRRRKAAIS